MAIFKQRSDELELMDTGAYTAEEYEGCLRELRRVNRLMGDARALRKTLLREIAGENRREFSALDVGAGSGELLRTIGEFARGGRMNFRLVGLELNARSAKSILEESSNFAAEISSVRGDALRLPFADGAFDYAVCTLFTHHFTDENIVQILGEMRRVSRRRIFAVDLHRHRAAYYLYTTAGRLILKNRLTRSDGALSILRSFKPSEMEDLARRAGMREFSVERHFPFRLVLQGN